MGDFLGFIFFYILSNIPQWSGVIFCWKNYIINLLKCNIIKFFEEKTISALGIPLVPVWMMRVFARIRGKKDALKEDVIYLPLKTVCSTQGKEYAVMREWRNTIIQQHLNGSQPGNTSDLYRGERAPYLRLVRLWTGIYSRWVYVCWWEQQNMQGKARTGRGNSPDTGKNQLRMWSKFG